MVRRKEVRPLYGYGEAQTSSISAAAEEEEEAAEEKQGEQEEQQQATEAEAEAEAGDGDGDGDGEGEPCSSSSCSMDPFFVSPLVSHPCYPNSVKWSDDNLLALASQNLISILCPSSSSSPRSFVTPSSLPPFPLPPALLPSPELLPVCLARSLRPAARSIDWSPQGLAPHGGCLLAVCSRDHRVKLYRAPYCEFQSEWVEVVDLSEILYRHLCKTRFRGLGHANSSEEASFQDHREAASRSTWISKGKRSFRSSKEPQHRKAQKLREEPLAVLDPRNSISSVSSSLIDERRTVELEPTEVINTATEPTVFPNEPRVGESTELISTATEPTGELESTEIISRAAEPTVFPNHVDKVSNSCIPSTLYASYYNMLAYVVVACSQTLRIERPVDGLPGKKAQDVVLIGMGAKSGEVSVLRATCPQQYTLEAITSVPEVSLVGVFEAHGSWVSALCWGKARNKPCVGAGYEEEVFLATGSCDGSVKIWTGDARGFSNLSPSSGAVPLCLKKKVVVEDSIPVTSIALILAAQSSEHVQVGVGKASGSLLALEIQRSGNKCREARKLQAHTQAVTGIVWAFDGRCLYSCSQDNTLRAWAFSVSELVALPFPQGSALADLESLDTSSNLPNSILDGYFGLDLSKGSLALATLRGVSTEMLDPMYESKSIKAVTQVFWVGSQHFTVRLPHMPNIPQDVWCGMPRSDLVQWDSNLLSALHHFENTSYKLVLWDIVTCLSALKTVVGRGFLNGVVSKWLLGLGMVNSESPEDDFLLFTKSYRQCLSNASSRCLHIMSVIMRHLYLSGLNTSIDRKSSATLESSSNAEHSGALGNVWQRFLLDVENELRQRLTHFTLTVASSKQRYDETGKKIGVMASVGVGCMVKWVLENSSKVSSQLLAAAENFSQEQVKTERCSICKEKVPFVSAETGECQNRETHKLPRCSVSFEVCPTGTLWFCHSCARWASKQLPAPFFTLSSRYDCEQSKEILVLQDNVQPLCPFCGILLQRFLPDCFLRLCLI